ncbi:MAG: site-2 protease family protein [Desulfobacteraceae bacterium]|nr:site-2 protease family protein [Desulfobacteraceae bacterium]
METQILRGIILIIPLLMAVTIHEVAHGYAALRFGDPTAKLAGRLSLNPVKHLDPFGSILLPGLLIFSGAPFVFGYAKPVPVNFYNLTDQRLGTIVVSAAGIVVNLSCAAASGFLYRILQMFPQLTASVPGAIISQLLYAFCLISIVLAIFNLIPIPPLDGSRILAALLPPGARQSYESIGPFGILIVLMLLIMTDILDLLFIKIIRPLIIIMTGG